MNPADKDLEKRTETAVRKQEPVKCHDYNGGFVWDCERKTFVDYAKNPRCDRFGKPISK